MNSKFGFKRKMSARDLECYVICDLRQKWFHMYVHATWMSTKYLRDRSYIFNIIWYSSSVRKKYRCLSCIVLEAWSVSRLSRHLVSWPLSPFLWKLLKLNFAYLFHVHGAIINSVVGPVSRFGNVVRPLKGRMIDKWTRILCILPCTQLEYLSRFLCSLNHSC